MSKNNLKTKEDALALAKKLRAEGFTVKVQDKPKRRFKTRRK